MFASIKRKLESRCPELLANYCDVLLRRNQVKKLTEEEVKEKLTNIVSCRSEEYFILYLIKNITLLEK